MVSYEIYFRTFLATLPKRFNTIIALRKAKQKIDKKVLSGKVLTVDEISVLQEILGKDTIFRKAEKRNKSTLRHLTWKTLKSIENIEKQIQKLNQDTSILESVKETKDAGKVLSIVKNVFGNVPRLKDIIKEISQIYEKEYVILERMKNGDLNAISDYQNLVGDKEDRITEWAKGILSDYERSTITLKNLIIQYNSIIRGRNLPRDIGIGGHYLSLIMAALFGYTFAYIAVVGSFYAIVATISGGQHFLTAIFTLTEAAGLYLSYNLAINTYREYFEQSYIIRQFKELIKSDMI